MKKLIRKFIFLAVISAIIGYNTTKDKQAENTYEQTEKENKVKVITQAESVTVDFSFQQVENDCEDVKVQTTSQRNEVDIAITPSPTKAPVSSDSPAPTLTPTEVPAPTLTTEPTVEPTSTPVPTVEPTPILTIQPIAEPTPIPTQQPTPSPVPQVTVDINHWVSFAQNYAQSIGLVLESSAVDCWDNPIPVNLKTLYVEQNIVDRLTRYKNLEGFTDVWIWYEDLGNSIYNLYIGYA